MKFLHLTHSKNLKSIQKYGLIPTYIDNDSHWETFEKYIKERKCIYMWDAETYNNSKYLRDMIYTKMFNVRYNQIVKNNSDDWEDDDRYINFKKLGNRLYGDDGRYMVLEINSEKINYFGEWRHCQTPGGTVGSTTVVMDDKYAHEDKKIYITKNPLSIDHIKIVEQINVRIYNNKKLGFTFRKKQ